MDTSATLKLPTDANAGDLIVVWVRWGAIPTTATVSDTLNNTWTPVSDAIESSAHGAGAQMFYTINQASGSNTINVDYSQSVPRRTIIAAEYSGIVSSNPLDGEVHVLDGPPPPSVGPLTTSNARDLLFACAMSDVGDVGPWAAGSGYSLIQSDLRDIAEAMFVSTKGDYSASFIPSTGSSFISQLAAFKAVSATLVPVKITGQPASQSVSRGTSATFSVTATGDQLAYQWYSNKVAIAGATNALVRSAPATPANNGDQYYAIVSGPLNSVTSSVAVLFVSPISRVQSADSGTFPGPSAALSLLTNTIAGNLIVVWVGWGAIPATPTVSDTLNNTWRPVSAAIVSTGQGTGAQMFYTINRASGSNTINVTSSEGVPLQSVIASEYSGIASPNPLDGEVHALDSATASVGPLTTSNASDLLFACSMSESASAGNYWSAGSGYTLIQSETLEAAEDMLVSTTGSYSAFFNAYQGTAFISQLAAFKAAAAPSSPPAFTTVNRSGDTVRFSFSGSPSALLWSTNVEAPVGNWMIYQAAPASPITISMTNSSAFFILKQ